MRGKGGLCYTPAKFVKSPNSQMSRKPIDKPSADFAL